MIKRYSSEMTCCHEYVIYVQNRSWWDAPRRGDDPSGVSIASQRSGVTVLPS